MTKLEMSDIGTGGHLSAQSYVWLTAKEAAQHLKVATRTILSWARDGKLKGHTLSGTERHVWRFLRIDLDAMLISSSVQPHSQRVRV
jgi:excisionase family DNA binding protein